MAIHETNHCIHCGYDLRGLSFAGQCPECGSRYDKSIGMGIKEELTPETRGARLMARIRTIFLAVLAVMVVGCGGLVTWLSGRPRAVWLGVLVGAVLVLATVTSFVYEKGED